MAKKKKFKLPAESKSFIEGLVKPAVPVELGEKEQESIAENALLIDTSASLDKIIDIVEMVVAGLGTIRKYDHFKLQDQDTHRAWLFNTYIGPALRPGVKLHQRHIVNPDYQEPEVSPKSAGEEQNHVKAMAGVENNDHKMAFFIKHMVNKEPFVPLKDADQVSEEDNLLLVEYNAISVHMYHIMSSASLIYRLLKSGRFGVSMDTSEAGAARTFMNKKSEDYSINVLSFIGYYIDVYLYLCNKMNQKPIDIKKIVFASRLHHQAARTVIGLGNHLSMCDTLAYFWKTILEVLREFKKEFPALIDRHHQDKLVIFVKK